MGRLRQPRDYMPRRAQLRVETLAAEMQTTRCGETLLEETPLAETLTVETLKAKNCEEHTARVSLRPTRLDRDGSCRDVDC